MQSNKFLQITCTTRISPSLSWFRHCVSGLTDHLWQANRKIEKGQEEAPQQGLYFIVSKILQENKTV